MANLTRSTVEDIRGAVRIAVDAAVGVTGIVESMHRTIQQGAPPLGPAVTERTRGITGFVYRRVRGTMGLVGQGLDLALRLAADRLQPAPASAGRDIWRSRINGLWGDHLALTGNPLALPMTLTPGGPPTRRLLILVHGLCMSDRDWCRDGHDHGQRLAELLGATPVRVQYNSGRRVCHNGSELASRLETLLAQWPGPVDDVTLIGHSMGGLVLRSALHFGRSGQHRWADQVSRIVFLGTPHFGAPLERGGYRLDATLATSPYLVPFTRIGRVRSAGITDLRHGAITEDGEIQPLPRSIASFAVAARLSARPTRLSESLIGDGLVPVDSALGRHPEYDLGIPETGQWIGEGMNHFHLLSHPEVYKQLERWLTPAAAIRA